MKIRNNLTASTFHEMSYNFSKAGMKNLAETRSHVRALSRFEPVKFACCINSCICYTGPYADYDKCPNCGISRLNESGGARRTFSYIPLIPRLRALMSNRTYATHFQYRADEHTKARKPGTITDIFDGLHYRSLLGEPVVVGDQTYPHNYFSDNRDIALGFATDGFAPFKRRKLTAWILLIFNYNLPPEQRFRKDNILCVGIIPGPKKPWNADSFIYPLVRELLELARGVSAYDALSRHLFVLHAYLITGFGDIPAVSMLMHMKGHNGLCPCRMCSIIAIRMPDSRNKTLYVPLSRRNHPMPTDVVEYRPENLPLRSHDHFMAQAEAVESAPTEVQREELAKTYGIKGTPLLSALGSLRFPQSFPYDFMHLIWENLIPNLVLFWSGRYKGMDEGQPYVLSPHIWQAVGTTSAAATKTIPSSFGASIPNPATDCSSFTSSTWSVWSLFIAPTVLQGRFPEGRYHTHFCSLVKILNLCLQFEISEKDINEIELGIRKWVVDYEWYVRSFRSRKCEGRLDPCIQPLLPAQA
jgi:Transposase family tnp2